MLLEADSAMAAVRAAVAEQRAATLALDPQRLGAANERLSAALARVQQEKAAEVPPESIEVAAIARDLKINAELVARGQATASRGVQAISQASALYGQDGAPVAAAATSIRPIAAA